MSYFICLGVSNSSFSVGDLFAQDVNLSDASSFPFGVVTIGGYQDGRAYLVTMNGSSTELLGRGPTKKNHPEYFINGVEKLLQHLHSVAFVVHWFTGMVKYEKVSISHKESISFAELKTQFSSLQEDTRYIITR